MLRINNYWVLSLKQNIHTIPLWGSENMTEEGAEKLLNQREDEEGCYETLCMTWSLWFHEFTETVLTCTRLGPPAFHHGARRESACHISLMTRIWPPELSGRRRSTPTSCTLISTCIHNTHMHLHTLLSLNEQNKQKNFVDLGGLKRPHYSSKNDW